MKVSIAVSAVVVFGFSSCRGLNVLLHVSWEMRENIVLIVKYT